MIKINVITSNVKWTHYIKNPNDYLDRKNLDFPKSSKNLEINIIENKDNFSDDEWKSLYQLSENTFVEETDSLKKGAAGAGLTDND